MGERVSTSRRERPLVAVNLGPRPSAGSLSFGLVVGGVLLLDGILGATFGRPLWLILVGTLAGLAVIAATTIVQRGSSHFGFYVGATTVWSRNAGGKVTGMARRDEVEVIEVSDGEVRVIGGGGRELFRFTTPASLDASELATAASLIPARLTAARQAVAGDAETGSTATDHRHPRGLLSVRARIVWLLAGAFFLSVWITQNGAHHPGEAPYYATGSFLPVLIVAADMSIARLRRDR